MFVHLFWTLLVNFIKLKTCLNNNFWRNYQTQNYTVNKLLQFYAKFAFLIRGRAKQIKSIDYIISSESNNLFKALSHKSKWNSITCIKMLLKLYLVIRSHYIMVSGKLIAVSKIYRPSNMLHTLAIIKLSCLQVTLRIYTCVDKNISKCAPWITLLWFSDSD